MSSSGGLEPPANASSGALRSAVLAEPYRLFFPLGIVLTWVAVVPWLAFAMGIVAEPPILSHALLQVQGFLTCFVIGFLWTAIPKRTGTAPARGWQVVLAAVLVVASAAFLLADRRGDAEACWLLLMAQTAWFVMARFRRRRALRSPPRSFLWLPVGFACAFLGAGAIGAYAALGAAWFSLHDFGRGLILQGMLFCFVVGVGGMLLPLITRGEVAPDMTRADWPRAMAHGVAALLLFGSFAVETWYSARLGHGLRALLAFVLLLTEAKIHRRPTVAGAHRLVVWASAWAIPLGYGWAAAQPQFVSAALHVVLLGGFGTMALSVSLHVVLSHGGAMAQVHGRPWPVLAMAGGLALALAARVAAVLDAVDYVPWLALAAAAFLLATLCWAWLALPWIVRARPSPRGC